MAVLPEPVLFRLPVAGSCEETPFSGYQWSAFFNPEISTSGLSTSVTVGGTGSSLGQTTGETAKRMHIPEVAKTIETLSADF